MNAAVARTVAASPPVAAILLHAGIYTLLGIASLATAFIQPNTAAVWLPSGYATGLLLALGLRYWPAVALGAFVVNVWINMSVVATPMGAWAAVLIAAGNTLEAMIAAHLTQRFCAGTAFLNRTANLIRFLALPLPVAPLASVISGIIASRIAGLQAHDGLLQVALTWYVADAAGILTFAALTVFALSGRIPRPSADRLAEGVFLFLALAFASQAVCGLYIAEWVENWPKAYMIIPLLLWASYRFGAVGGLMAIAMITIGASIGTLRGFQVFPAPNAWLCLLYLQIYLSMLAIMTLSVSAALAEAHETRAELEHRVKARTAAVEQLLQRRRVMTALVAHDLQSPVYGMRSTLRTIAAGLENATLDREDVVPALGVVDETCSALGERIDALLAIPIEPDTVTGVKAVPLSRIIANIQASHQLRLDARRITIEVDLAADPVTRQSGEVEHILDALIDNAIRHAPEGGTVRIAMSSDERETSVTVADDGPGVAPDRIAKLFRRDGRKKEDGSRASLGLALAAEQARWLDGRLTYTPDPEQGAIFTLTLPTGT